MRTSPPPTPPPPVQPSVVNHKNWLNDGGKIRNLAYVQTIITLIVLIPNAIVFKVLTCKMRRGYIDFLDSLDIHPDHDGLEYVFSVISNAFLQYWPAITLGVAAYYSIKSIRQAQNRRKNLFISVAISAATLVLEMLILLILFLSFCGIVSLGLL